MRHDAPLDIERDRALADSHVEDAPHPYGYGAAAPPSAARRVLLWIAVVLVLAAIAGGYYYWSQRIDPAPPAEPPPPRAATEPAREAPAGPAIQHPIEAARPDGAVSGTPEPATPLPALDTSDRTVADALAGLADRGTLDAFLITTGLIRKVVVTIDNLPHKKAPQRLWPLQPTAQAFRTTGAGDAVYASPDNARRYEPALRLMESVDTGKLVAFYVRFYPLFQQAYRELGYPKAHFNDRLVEVIDHLLVTPEIDGPIRLARPWIMYAYADPALEARSAGQKTLIRMGAANQLRVKAKLREVRRQIAGRALKE